MAKYNFQPICILMAEDDPDDRLLVKEAFQESRVANTLNFVENGVELLNYLRKQEKYKNGYDFPDLVLLDLNMPRKDGRETLQEIKADPNLRHIPVVILTTSNAEEDVLRCYEMGAAGYITKPVTFEALIEITKGLSEYWVQIVRLPLKKA